ncbi:MAG TPA: trehalose-6-phosphate synthase [Longimicrobiales bacterium]|nr:trehalose-6-phosphate synthase [Longimicrobiales bacterium]
MAGSASPGAGSGAAGIGGIFRQALPDRRFVVVSNREPYEHYWDETADDVAVRRPAGGLVAALDPLMQAVGGVWIAWGSGDRDATVVDEHQRVRVPPETGDYTLHRIWLTPQDVHQYYSGYANQFLWPLCHLRPALTRTRSKYWQRYAAVNARFAAAVIEDVADTPAAVWFQDYHLATAPAILRAKRPDITSAHFWHIPFPPLEIFRVASQGPELLRGLLANDIMGFHLPLFCDNFLRCVESVLAGEVDVDWTERSATLKTGHTCSVRAFPISIDIDAFRTAASAPGAEGRIARLRQRYAPDGMMLGVGVDRIDYSKGLEEKLKAIDILFDQHPEFRERFTFVQIAVPSRTGIESYDRLNESVARLAWSINDRYGTEHWTPIHLITDSLPAERLALFYRAADICVVNSLQDGMNLVAKEFIASQLDSTEPGVLVLSKFAGAAEELDGAFEVNPYDPEATAEGLRTALLLHGAERVERMNRLRASLRTIYDWMGEVFTVWGAAARGERVPLSEADRWSRVR